MTDDSTFRKITFNAHEGTCAWFEGRYGYGWTTQLRELMDRHMIDTNRSDVQADMIQRRDAVVIDKRPKPRIIGDIYND